MHKLDLKKIIDQYDLDTKKVAAELFPENKYPNIALSRVINGDALLDTEQVSKLSFLSGIPISDLFEGSKWQNCPVKASDANTLIFENGEYKVRYDRSTHISKVYHKESLFHESVIIDGDSVPLSQYFDELDKLILNYIQNGNN